ncbi:MAG: efflux RND transporter periplasmic adaptor subunit [Pirellulales bacterium]|nr:efflux RND transporter periplasmic adaptor subunit [Pirellulales bacterium]
MKTTLKWLVGLGLFAGLCYGGYTLAAARWSSDPTARFRQERLVRGDVATVVNSTGSIKPVLSVEIGSFVSGPIASSFVDFNTRVKKGDELARIDPRIYEANVASDEASLAHAEADVKRVEALLEQSRRNEQRAIKLKERKATYIAEQELDQLKADRRSFEAQLAVAQATVEQAQAKLELSRANLGYTIITSPVDGIVIDRKIEPGQTVAAQFQTPVLFVVAPDLESKIHVLASVDEADIGMIRKAQETSQPVTFTVDAYPDDLFEGRVAQVRLNSTKTQNVVTYTVVVEAPNAELKLLPGMTANLSFQIEKHADVLKIPNAALRYFPRADQVRPEDRPILEGGKPLTPKDEESGSVPDTQSATERVTDARNANKRHVWVLKDRLLAAVAIETGISDSRFSEVLSGDLQEGQQVVIGTRNAELGGR